MANRPTILLVVADRSLYGTAAATLDSADYDTTGDLRSPDPAPDMIIRHWRDERRFDRPSVPVLTLDLSVVGGEDLIEVVDRVLGRYQHRRFTTLAEGMLN